MNHELEPTGHHVRLTRREALLNAFKGTVAISLTAPVIVQAAPPALAPMPEPEFVPENDYPFFGGEMPEGF